MPCTAQPSPASFSNPRASPKENSRALTIAAIARLFCSTLAPEHSGSPKITRIDFLGPHRGTSRHIPASYPTPETSLRTNSSNSQPSEYSSTYTSDDSIEVVVVVLPENTSIYTHRVNVISSYRKPCHVTSKSSTRSPHKYPRPHVSTSLTTLGAHCETKAVVKVKGNDQITVFSARLLILLSSISA
jgi:hypothetical protein